MRLVARTLDQIYSPIGAAHALVAERPGTRPLLDLSQAAPSCPPPDPIRDHLARVVASPDGGRYAPQAGLPDLREAMAQELSAAYRGEVRPDQVLITAGCNQAFALVSSSLCEAGDRVILPDPYYFNHDMWLRLDGTGVDHLPTGSRDTDGRYGQPDPERAEAMMTDRTRAIVLVTPGNPTGVTIEAKTIEAFADLARRTDTVLIIDETYRCFRPADVIDSPAHSLFAQPGWDDHVVSLHSFSKEFAIPGYRVGAAVGHPDLLAQALKLLDCVTICAPRIGQEAALAGLTEATGWRTEQAARIRSMQTRFEALMAERPGGFELVTAGAYFGWVRAPQPHASTAGTTAEAVRDLLFDRDVLAIPGSAFTANSTRPTPGGGEGPTMVRMSFANLEPDDITVLGQRLAEPPSQDRA